MNDDGQKKNENKKPEVPITKDSHPWRRGPSVVSRYDADARQIEALIRRSTRGYCLERGRAGKRRR
jgi:hypothetical protein